MSSSLQRGKADISNTPVQGSSKRPGFVISTELLVKVRVRKVVRPIENSEILSQTFSYVGNLSQADTVFREILSLITTRRPQELQIQARDIFQHLFNFKQYPQAQRGGRSEIYSYYSFLEIGILDPEMLSRIWLS